MVQPLRWLRSSPARSCIHWCRRSLVRGRTGRTNALYAAANRLTAHWWRVSTQVSALTGSLGCLVPFRRRRDTAVRTRSSNCCAAAMSRWSPEPVESRSRLRRRHAVQATAEAGRRSPGRPSCSLRSHPLTDPHPPRCTARRALLGQGEGWICGQVGDLCLGQRQLVSVAVVACGRGHHESIRSVTGHPDHR